MRSERNAARFTGWALAMGAAVVLASIIAVVAGVVTLVGKVLGF